MKDRIPGHPNRSGTVQQKKPSTDPLQWIDLSYRSQVDRILCNPSCDHIALGEGKRSPPPPLDQRTAEYIAQLMQENPQVTHLTLACPVRNNDKSLHVLNALLCNTRHIKRLSLYNIKHVPQGCCESIWLECLNEGLFGNSSIEHLQFSNYEFLRNQKTQVNQLLQHCASTRLRSLHFVGCSFNNEISFLTQALQSQPNHNLVDLMIVCPRSNPVATVPSQQFLQDLSTVGSATLESLELEGFLLGIKELMELLQSARGLQRLSLRGCRSLFSFPPPRQGSRIAVRKAHTAFVACVQAHVSLTTLVLPANTPVPVRTETDLYIQRNTLIQHVRDLIIQGSQTRADTEEEDNDEACEEAQATTHTVSPSVWACAISVLANQSERDVGNTPLYTALLFVLAEL